MLTTKKKKPNLFSKPIVWGVPLPVHLLPGSLCQETPIITYQKPSFYFHYKAFPLAWLPLDFCQIQVMVADPVAIQQVLNKYLLLFPIWVVSTISTKQWVLIWSPTSTGTLLIQHLLPHGKRNFVHPRLHQDPDACLRFTYRAIYLVSEYSYIVSLFLLFILYMCQE